MNPREAFLQISACAEAAAKAFPASGNIALIEQICRNMLAGTPVPLSDQRTFWAAWHPQHGFEVPHEYEGAVAFADLDPVASKVRTLNADDKTNNRNGWRATKVTLVKAKS